MLIEPQIHYVDQEQPILRSPRRRRKTNSTRVSPAPELNDDRVTGCWQALLYLHAHVSTRDVLHHITDHQTTMIYFEHSHMISTITGINSTRPSFTKCFWNVSRARTQHVGVSSFGQTRDGRCNRLAIPTPAKTSENVADSRTCCRYPSPEGRHCHSRQYMNRRWTPRVWMRGLRAYTPFSNRAQAGHSILDCSGEWWTLHLLSSWQSQGSCTCCTLASSPRSQTDRLGDV